MAYYNDSELQPVHAADAWDLDRYLFTAVAYIARAGKKNGSNYDEDVLKALWFLAYAVTKNTNYSDTVKSVCNNLKPREQDEERQKADTSNKLSSYVGAEAATGNVSYDREVCREAQSELVREKCNNALPELPVSDRHSQWLKGAIE
jgi:hypothetical protein